MAIAVELGMKRQKQNFAQELLLREKEQRKRSGRIVPKQALVMVSLAICHYEQM